MNDGSGGSVQPVHASPHWHGAAPEISVCVSAYQRAHFLAELLESLESQSLPRDRFEVVMVDNGSSDATWTQLRELADATELRMAVHRIETNRGPARARNLAASICRAPVIAFTDDDCIADRRWLESLLDGFGNSVDIVQGATRPDPRGDSTAGPWDRTIEITGETPFFETCNIAYRAELFGALGGFPAEDPLSARPGGRAFGEDALLGAAAHDHGARRVFAPAALVFHRYHEGGFGDRLREVAALGWFPSLAARSVPMQRRLVGGVFLNRRQVELVSAVGGVALAAATRRLIFAGAAVPWSRAVLREARWRSRNTRERRAVVAAQVGLADLYGLGVLARGSVGAGRVVL